jgi:hypothetical protein
MSSRLNERLAILGVVNPASHSTGNQDTAAVDMKNFGRAMFVVLAGNLSGGGVLDFKLMSSATSGGTYTDVTGKSITSMNNADGGNGQAIVELLASDLPDGHRFVKGRLTIATAASPAAVVALGGDSRYAPIGAFDLASVVRLVD